MHHQKSAKPPVSFQEVADCFSEVEWKLLQKWQNELYKNLMKEFQQVLTLMGPVIASSVFSLRAKEYDDVYTEDAERIVATETRPSSNHSAGTVVATSVFSLRAKDYEDVYIEDTERVQDTKQRPSNNLSASHRASKVSATLKEEEEGCHIGYQDPTERQNIDCPRTFFTEFPSSESEVCCMVQSDTEVRLGSTSDKPGIAYTTQLILSNIKDEGAACYMDHDEVDMNERMDYPLVDPKITRMFQQTDLQSSNTVFQTAKVDQGENTADPIIARVFQQSNVQCSNTIHHAAQVKQGVNTADLIIERVFQQSDVQSNNTIQQAAQGSQCENAAHYSEAASRNDSASHTHFDSQKNVSHRFILEQQQRIDRCEKLFPCRECGKSFTQETSLQQHQKVHTARPFQCTQCGRSFTLKGNLNKHQKMHTIGRPFQCTQCEKSFNVKSSLERHLMLHTGVRPFVCTECEKTFIRKSALLQHLKNAHGTDVFVLQ